MIRSLNLDAAFVPTALCEIEFDIIKDPTTDDGTKKSFKGLLQVKGDNLKDQCTWEEEENSDLKTIFVDGKFVNQTSLSEIRQRINSII
jgi:nicotinamide phosphoribosyltransferase